MKNWVLEIPWPIDGRLIYNELLSLFEHWLIKYIIFLLWFYNLFERKKKVKSDLFAIIKLLK